MARDLTKAQRAVLERIDEVLDRLRVDKFTLNEGRAVCTTEGGREIPRMLFGRGEGVAFRGLVAAGAVRETGGGYVVAEGAAAPHDCPECEQPCDCDAEEPDCDHDCEGDTPTPDDDDDKIDDEEE